MRARRGDREALREVAAGTLVLGGGLLPGLIGTLHVGPAFS
jgi:hypothetical protein